MWEGGEEGVGDDRGREGRREREERGREGRCQNSYLDGLQSSLDCLTEDVSKCTESTCETETERQRDRQTKITSGLILTDSLWLTV